MRDDERYENARRLLNHGQYVEALKIYRSLAEAGDPQCQVVVGWMYFEGRGIPKDIDKALDWFGKAASLGSKEGAYYSGMAFLVLDRHEEAISRFQAAARQEYGPALLWLGISYVRGLGVTADFGKGVNYLRRAENTGNRLAKRELALLMAKGKFGISKIPVGLVLLPFSIVTAIVDVILKGHSERLVG